MDGEPLPAEAIRWAPRPAEPLRLDPFVCSPNELEMYVSALLAEHEVDRLLRSEAMSALVAANTKIAALERRNLALLEEVRRLSAALRIPYEHR